MRCVCLLRGRQTRHSGVSSNIDPRITPKSDAIMLHVRKKKDVQEKKMNEDDLFLRPDKFLSFLRNACISRSHKTAFIREYFKINLILCVIFFYKGRSHYRSAIAILIYCKEREIFSSFFFLIRLLFKKLEINFRKPMKLCFIPCRKNLCLN